METINDNIRQLLEMLDNPEAYTEQEIQNIITAAQYLSDEYVTSKILEVNGAEDRFSEAEKEELIKKKNDLYVSFVKTLTPDDMLPGISEFIERAKAAGLKTAVASVSKNAPLVLSCLGAADKFDYVADASKVTKSKPAPDIFLVCAEALGVDPADCIGISDRYLSHGSHSRLLEDAGLNAAAIASRISRYLEEHGKCPKK